LQGKSANCSIALGFGFVLLNNVCPCIHILYLWLYIPELTPERTPEFIKKFYFNWLLAIKLKVMMTIELCILN
jgi:hypothetical protein